MPVRKRIIITGELPLAEEYGVLLSGAGFAVSIRPNTGEPAVKFPKGITKAKALPRGAFCGIELTNLNRDAKQKNLKELEKALSPSALLLTSSVTISLSEQTGWVRNPDRLVGIGALPSLLDGDLLELTSCSSTAGGQVREATELARKIKKDTAVVRDRVGMVLPRILCTLANEACFAMGEGVAQAHDIDTAMKLGTNYPSGPVEWAERIGAGQVHGVIKALYLYYGEDRYRPAPLLTEAARRGSFRPG